MFSEIEEVIVALKQQENVNSLRKEHSERKQLSWKIRKKHRNSRIWKIKLRIFSREYNKRTERRKIVKKKKKGETENKCTEGLTSD